MARGTWGGTTDPHIFKVDIHFIRSGQHCQTGFHVRDVAINDNTEQEVADQARTVLWDAFRPLLCTTDTVDFITARILGGDTGAVAAGNSQAGTSTADAAAQVPSFMCALLTLKSEIRKRYGQGRMFMPVVAESQIDTNDASTTLVGGMNTFITAMTDNFTGDPVTHDLLLVNAHGVIPPLAPGPHTAGHPEIPASWYDVVSVRLNTQLTSLRTRKVGHGS